MSIGTNNSINLFQYAQQSQERSQKIQIPKIRGNLSSFNDLMSYDSMKIENQALNNLRNMSEDKLDQYLTNLNSNSNTNNQNVSNNNTFSLNCNNSIMSNNLYYQNCNQLNIPNQPFSPEKRKSSNIVGWDYDDSTIQEQQNEDGDITTDKQIQNEGSTMLQSHSGSEKQCSSQSTMPIPQLGLLKSISKKSSCIQLMTSAADLSEQPTTQQQSFSELNATSPSSFFKKQTTFSKPLPIMRSQSPSIHSSGQDKSPTKARKPSKVIKIRTPSATPLEQNNQSPNEKTSEVSKNNSNNGQLIQTQPQANNTLYYKKILQNTKILQQRQKALAQFQTNSQSQSQVQSNLKTSQSSALYHISNNSVHEKYSSPLRGSISKSTHSGAATADNEAKLIHPQLMDKQNQENNHNFQKLDFGSVQIPKLSYLNLSKGKRNSKYSSNTENSHLKTDGDCAAVSPLTNDILSQSTSDFQSVATKYVNYTQKLYKNIQSSIDYLQKQFDNPIDKKQLLEITPKEGNKSLYQQLPQQHQHTFIKQQYYTLVNKNQIQQSVYPLQQINQPSIVINSNNNNKNIIEQPTYKNYQKLSVHKKQAKSVDRMAGQSSTISPNQSSPRREQHHYKTNISIMNATSQANILQQKVIHLGGNNILSYCIKNRPLIRSSSQYQKKIDQVLKSHNDSSLSISKPLLKTSDISASLQMQLQQAFLNNDKQENNHHSYNHNNNNNNNTGNNNNNVNTRLEIKPKNSFLKFDPIFTKKI